MSNSSNSLCDLVDDILWTEWDPIGVRDLGAPRDEYRDYVDAIVSLLENSVSVEFLGAHLLRLETEMMCLPGDPARAPQVATMLISAGETD